MRRGILCVAVTLFVFALAPLASQAGQADAEGWISLFNGKNLNGWKLNEPDREKPTFTVEDGKIVVDGPRQHLFYDGGVENHNFKNFEFQAEVMTFPKANSGIYFHTAYQDSGWPSQGYEVQVNQTHGDPVKTGSLYNVVKLYAETNPAKDEEWYRYHISVRDNHIVVKIVTDLESDNPKVKTVVDYTEPDNLDREQPRLSRGTFALQGHDPGSRIYYRNIKVKPLPDVLGDGEGWVPLFNGENLDGWKKAEENEETFQVEDGMIVINKEKKYGRCHLFYDGPVENAQFKNFEFKADVMTKPGANSGIYFHTKYQAKGWPSVGYESQVNQSYAGDPKKTGGLYNVVNISADENPAEDNKWYTQHIIVIGNRVVVRVIKDIDSDDPKAYTIVTYTEPEDLARSQPRLSEGTFALQAHDPGSVIYYKNIRVRPLPDSLGSNEGWVSMFDGKSLDGWQQINGTANYEIVGDTIVGTTAEGSPNSFLCSKQNYSDFELKFDVKCDPRLNSGVQIRSESTEDYRDSRVHGYQVEIAANNNPGRIYDEARRARWLDEQFPEDPAPEPHFYEDDWNRYHVVCVGDMIMTWVNDINVAYVVDSMTDEGFIGLQVHSFRGDSPAKVAWRNIYIKPVNYQE